jgi:hypothetical protein
MKLTHLTRIGLAVALCLLPVAALWVILLFQGIDAETARSTLAGMPAALGGGVLAGAAAEALVNRSKSTFQTLVGLGLSAGIGVLTIGYINLIHIGGPMDAMGTTRRVVEQVTLFVAFLMAQGAGILLAPVVLPSRREDDAAPS